MQIRLVNYWPEPVSDTDCVPSSSVITTFEARATAAFGVIVTVIVQLAPPAKLAVQSLLCEKLVKFPVAIAMLEIAKGALPVFDKMTD
jgi:hypothetical protein